MNRRRLRSIAPAAAVLVSLVSAAPCRAQNATQRGLPESAAAGDEANTGAAPLSVPRPSPTGNKAVPFPTDGWPTNGGDLFNRRYSPLTEIDRSNVARLKGVWRTHLGGSGVGPQYSGEAQPLVADGVIYVVTGADDVFALGVDTGEIQWSYRANLDPSDKAVCCGWTSRGVAVG
ncbi:MAG TPA: PQQ-binding-like beta-propeller repeat protein, partial [Gammaproteobacteria bacterium]|nr:PQQ-binding-like beta-propeller repeat protein [Gammaproteobacteria bacterium]